jgi:hypothetical protein
MHNNNHKGRASTLSKALLTAGLLGIVGYGNAANAASKFFYNQKIDIPDETFIFDLETDDSLTIITRPGHMNSGLVTPTDPSNPLAVRTDSNPLLTSELYTFKGYKIKNILNGKRYENGVYTGDIKYRGETLPAPPPYIGTNAEDVGVFNYLVEVPPNTTVPPAVKTYPTDLIAHDIPDDLWNPGGIGAGFTATPSLPSSALDNYVSFGGFGFDVYDVGTTTFDEPYQIFTVSKQPTGGNFQSLLPGDYAGCPGSCVGAKINQVPGPLPLLGVGAAFGFSRNLRKRIKTRKSPGVMSALG